MREDVEDGHLSRASTFPTRGKGSVGCLGPGAIPKIGTWEEEQVGGTHGLGTFCEVELMGFLGPGWKTCAQHSARCPWGHPLRWVVTCLGKFPRVAWGCLSQESGTTSMKVDRRVFN